MKHLIIGAAVAAAIGSSGYAESMAGRGAYLAAIGGCGDCHTPHGPDGQPIAGKTLAGAPLPFAPTVRMPWAGVAPPLAGGPAGYSEVALARLLRDGRRPDGSTPRPPMPDFHMTAADANAVARYVFSVKKAD